MDVTLIRRNNKAEKVVAIVPLQNRLFELDVSDMRIESFGTSTISSVTNGQLNEAIIFHTENSRWDAIDVENTIIERTNLIDTQIKHINIQELVVKLVPPDPHHFKTHIMINNNEIICNVKSKLRGTTELSFITTLKLSKIRINNIKDRLSSFCQYISKITNFIEHDHKSSIAMSKYLEDLRETTGKSFNTFTATQFQPLLSVARCANSVLFYQWYDTLSYDEDTTINAIKKDLNTIIDRVTERNTFNFKGVKVYTSKDTVTFNLLGYPFGFGKPDEKTKNILFSHIGMCGQLMDFKIKLERIKLLHA